MHLAAGIFLLCRSLGTVHLELIYPAMISVSDSILPNLYKWGQKHGLVQGIGHLLHNDLSRMKKFLYSILFASLLFLPGISRAQAGTPDESFSNDGKRLFSLFDEAHGSGLHVAVQPDGKILVTGGAGLANGNRSAIVLRMLPDGLEDPEFGENGFAIISIPGTDVYGLQSILLEDGKILVLVSRDSNQENLVAVFRLFPDGNVDQNFGTNGHTSIDLGTYTQAPRMMALQSDGKIVVGGYIGNSGLSDSKFFLTRFTPEGELDTIFGDQGVVLTKVNTGVSRMYALALYPDDRISTTGFIIQNGHERTIALRYLPNGDPDPSFDGDGMVLIPIPDTDTRPKNMVIQSDNKLVIGGEMTPDNGNMEIMAIRLMEDGSLDQDFHQTGIHKIAVSNYTDGANGMLLQPDGKIVLAGFTHGSAPEAGSTCLVRLKSSGYPDPDFGQNGVVDFDAYFQNSEILYSIALQPDGKIVGTGSMFNGTYNKIYVSRFLSGFTVSNNDLNTPEDQISVFPNPASDYLQIQYPSGKMESPKIRLIDQDGRVIQTRKTYSPDPYKMNSLSLELDDSILPGVYYLHIDALDKNQVVPVVICK